MWLLFLVILVGTLNIARAEPDSRTSTYVDDPPADDPIGESDDDDASPDDVDVPAQSANHAGGPATFDAQERDRAEDRERDHVDVCEDYDREDDDLDGDLCDASDRADAEQLVATEVGDGAIEGANELDPERELAAGSEAREEEWLEGPDAREASLRSRKSWLGRIDVGITARRAFVDAGPDRTEVFLVAAWRL